MNTKQELDRIVRDWLEDRVADPPQGGMHEAIQNATTTPRTRRRSLGRWLERVGGARRRTGEHDHPSDGDSRRHRLMLSASGLVAAFAMLALAVSVTGPSDQAQPPAAETGETHVVAADGSGDFSTIGEAVEAAADGDTILVRPGRYVEAIVIDKDITLMGDGPREDIVILAPEDGPIAETGSFARVPSRELPYAFLLVDSGATVSGLTLTGPSSTVHARGGAPLLQDLVFNDVGLTMGEGGCCFGNGGGLLIAAGSAATIRDSEFVGGGQITIYDGSDPVIVDNVLIGGPHIGGNPGLDAVIRGNTIIGTLRHGIAIYDPEPVGAIIEGNTIRPARGSGIHVGYSISTGVNPIIRGNVITGGTSGIYVEGWDARPTIEANEISGSSNGLFIGGPASVLHNDVTDNMMGIVVSADALVEGNTARGNESLGILVTDGSPALLANRVEDNGVGIRITGAGDELALSGNVVCGNGTDLDVAEGLPMPDTSDNEICGDERSE